MKKSSKIGVASLLVCAATSVACSGDGGGDPGDSSSGGSSTFEGDGDGDGHPGTGGSVGDGDGDHPGDGDGDFGGVSCISAGQDVGPSVLRRLSKVEYQLTLQDLFLLDEPPSVEAIPDDVTQEGFSTFSAPQNISAAHLRAYWETVSPLASDLASAKSSECGATSGTCLDDFVAHFGRLAFRRELTPSEVETYVSRAEANALDGEDQFQYVIESLLVAPEFLFRVEIGDDTEGLSRLASNEVASKLSFALWGRAPSEELLDRAEAGELDSQEGIELVASEMLEHENSRYFFTHFFRQWLGYGKLRAPVEPPEDWSDDLMPLMVQETDTLVDTMAWDPGAHFLDILTENSTTVAPDLARFYGDDAGFAGPNQAVEVEYPEGDPRQGAGVLGHAAILSQKTDGDKVSVRGNWLRRTFLCEELEIPAEVAEILGEQLVGLTSMEIIEERNTQPSCKKCHGVIDPIGVGLARFDSTGRFDPEVDVEDYPIAAGFPDAEDPSFSSLGELAAKLRAMPEVSSCVAERVFIYTEGRHPETEDACAYEAASDGFASEGGSFSSLVRHLVSSPGFRLRRAPDSPM